MSTPEDVVVLAVTDWLGELCALFQKPRYFQVVTPSMNDTVGILSALSYMRRTGDIIFVSSVDNIGNPFIIRSSDGRCQLSIGGEFTHAQQQELLRQIHGRYSYEPRSLNPDDFSDPKDKRKASEERRAAAEAYIAKRSGK